MTRDEMPAAAHAPAAAFKWKALLGLALIWTAAATGITWVWAALFIWWAITDVFLGETHFIERVPRVANPVTFWLIVASWIALSISWVVWI